MKQSVALWPRPPFVPHSQIAEHWCLSDCQPFPLNPTFRPLPPLADTVKTKIYNAYTYNILAKDATDSQVVRAVAAKFGIAMDRVRAVIRLKELEKSWKDQVRVSQRPSETAPRLFARFDSDSRDRGLTKKRPFRSILQGITLQTNLLENMESYLGVKQPVSSENWRGQEALSEKPAYASTKTLFEMVDEESVSSFCLCRNHIHR